MLYGLLTIPPPWRLYWVAFPTDLPQQYWSYSSMIPAYPYPSYPPPAASQTYKIAISISISIISTTSGFPNLQNSHTHIHDGCDVAGFLFFRQFLHCFGFGKVILSDIQESFSAKIPAQRQSKRWGKPCYLSEPMTALRILSGCMLCGSAVLRKLTSRWRTNEATTCVVSQMSGHLWIHELLRQG